LLILIIILMGAVLSFIYSLSRSLPDITALERETPSVKSIIYDRNSSAIGEFFVENRVIVDYDDIPEHVRNAFISVEDKYFYYHFGIDPTGIIRALYINIVKGGKVQGASTITQQLARNMFLTPEKKLIRKIKEAFLSLKIENRFTKKEIITFYLNQIYFGSGSYGIESASRKYFGKSVSEITVPEACLLAALPKAPERYNPFKNKDLAVERRNIALFRMFQENFISEDEYKKYSEEELLLAPYLEANGLFSYFIEEIRRYCYKTLGSELLLKGGLKIYSTMDRDMQSIAGMALRRGLENYDRSRYGYRKIENVPEEKDLTLIKPILEENYFAEIIDIQDVLLVQAGNIKGRISRESSDWIKKDPLKYFSVGDMVEIRFDSLTPKDGCYDMILTQTPIASGAVIILDINTSNILAMVGGYSFSDSEFNRAVQAYRQTGSVIKPLYYAAAIDNGFSQADMINDAPISYYDISTEDYWQPRNFKGLFYGRIPIRYALSQSINVASVKLLREIGVDVAISYLKKMGIQSYLAPYLSFALGSSDITLLEMAGAFSVFPSYGIYKEPRFISIISDNQGNVLDEKFQVPRRVIREDVAYVMIDMLKNVVQSGTAQRARNLEILSAGKTGTTNNFSDTWYIGFTPDIVIGVWVGNDEKTSLGNNRTGASVSLPIWIDIIKELAEKKIIINKEFFIPANIIFRDICMESGLIANSNCIKVDRMAFIKGSEPFSFCNMH